MRRVLCGISVFSTMPSLSAPGVNVRSSVPNNSYASFNGTSTASPHIPGAAALFMSHYDGLKRNVTNTGTKLLTAAEILNTTQGFGGDSPTDHPSNTFGWGRLDLFQAYNAINIYTDRSVYNLGDTMDVFLSLVSTAIGSAANFDPYVALFIPGAGLFFYPNFGTIPVPVLANFPLPPLLEVFESRFSA
jgi:subtilisin family serine protease